MGGLAPRRRSATPADSSSVGRWIASRSGSRWRIEEGGRWLELPRRWKVSGAAALMAGAEIEEGGDLQHVDGRSRRAVGGAAPDPSIGVDGISA
jgi:hypothetical protein